MEDDELLAGIDSIVRHEIALLSKLRVLDEASAQSRRLQEMGLDGIDNIDIAPTNEDVIIIKRFNLFVSAAERNAKGINIVASSYYTSYLHVPIQCLWKLITKNTKLFPNQFKSIDKNSGMQLLGLKTNNKRKKGLDTQIKTVPVLYKLLSGYCRSGYCSNLSTNSTSSTLRYIYSNKLDTAVGEDLAAWIRNNVPSPNKINYRMYTHEKTKKKMSPELPIDQRNAQPDASAVERSLQSMIEVNKHKSELEERQLCTTFKELVTVLQKFYGLCLDSDNQVAMTRDGWTTYLNSMLVSSMWFETLKSKFHPPCAEHSIPLDVLAGITNTEKYECIEEGPIIDLYLEKHPNKSHQHLCVTILQNHLSKSYVKNIWSRVKDSNFYLKHNKFVRVATKKEEGTHTGSNLDTFVGMEFGSDDKTYRILEAELANDVDDEAIKMTNYIFSVQDEAFRIACDILQTVLSVEKETQAEKVVTPNEKLINYQYLNRLDAESKKQLNEKLKSCGPIYATCPIGSDVFTYPISTNHIPLDEVDSVHTNISTSSSYTMHSDTCNKVGNHNDDYYHSHSLAMRILTQGFQCSALSTTLPSNNVSLIHGIPDGSNGFNYCKLHGRFSNGKFTFPPENESMRMGYATHAHLQPTGSQGDLQHSATNHEKNDICRMIQSSRSFRAHSLTLKEKIYRNAGCQTGKVISRSDQKFSNVIDHVLKRGRLKESVTATSPLQRPGRYGCLPIQGGRDPKRSIRYWPSNVMANGACEPSDSIKPKVVIGVKPCREYLRMIALGWTLIPPLAEIGVTLLVTHEERHGRGVKKYQSICGPYATQNNEGEYNLQRPWHTPVSNIHTREGVPTNMHHKHIIGEKRDVVIVVRPTKCHTTFLRACKTVATGEGELCEIIIRGSGGASYSAGNEPPRATDMDPTDPTFVLATPQRFDSYDHVAFQASIREGRSFNVFLGDRLIGLFRVKEIRNKCLSKEDFEKERNEFSTLLEELHELDPATFPDKTLTDQMMNELNSMTSIGNWYYLVPILPLLHKKFSSGVENIPWKVIEMDSETHFQLPKYSCERGDFQELKHTFTSLERMIEFTSDYDYTRFFSSKGYEVLSELLPEEEGDSILHKVSENPDPTLRKLFDPPKSTTRKLTLGVALGAAVHSCGLTTLKATSPELVTLDGQHGSKLSTATKRLSELVGKSASDLNEYHNLKNAMAKPVHPAHLGLEMPIGLCMLATGSLDESLREVNEDNKQWKKRVGGEFLLSKEGFDIAFRVICIIITSTGNFLDALYELNKKSFKPDGSIDTPLPASEELNSYLNLVESHNWSSTLVHKNFRGAIKTKNDYISFIENLSENGSQAFQRAMIDTSTTSRICNDRSKILNNFKTMFSSNMSTVFTEFQVHVIMRAIECCMHEPFGIVKEPVHGSGSREIARLLKRDFEGEKGMFNEQKMLEFMNDRANKSVNKGDDKEKQMRDELLVLGLEWSKPLDCLVHSIGIGKKFDVNDIEHLECMLYKMYFNTSPSMNVSSSFKFANGKFYPIKLKGKIAANEDFMKALFPKKDEVLEAYRRLLCDKTYEHNRLDEIFRIDLNEDNTDDNTDDKIVDLNDITLSWQKRGRIQETTLC